ncbi:hypothetical protein AB0J90_18820 [Micromonospora sp. NPDC049523]|uniref:hypothetical protein n=1 Tax=Micromonospora sp. NPDC049523 TaxID=3155921 RepID=UPI00341F7827
MLVMTSTAPAVARQPEQPDFSLKVTPSRVLVPADQTARPRQFTVTNQGRLPVDVVTRMESFTAGQDGNLLFQRDAPHSAVGWVSVQPERFSLDSGTTGQVSLHIAVPTTAEPGEHQVAVIFSVSAPDGHAGLGVSRSVGVPVYVTVPGEAVDSVEVSGLRAPGFTTGGPLDLTATVRNVGTVHRDFVADERVRAQVAGDTVAFSDFTLLRGADRQITARWADPPLFCVCRATVALPNPDGESRATTATIVILPLRLIGLVLLAGLTLLLGGLLLRRRLVRRRLGRLGRSGPGLPAPVGNIDGDGRRSGLT